MAAMTSRAGEHAKGHPRQEGLSIAKIELQRAEEVRAEEAVVEAAEEAGMVAEVEGVEAAAEESQTLPEAGRADFPESRRNPVLLKRLFRSSCRIS